MEPCFCGMARWMTLSTQMFRVRAYSHSGVSWNNEEISLSSMV